MLKIREEENILILNSSNSRWHNEKRSTKINRVIMFLRCRFDSSIKEGLIGSKSDLLKIMLWNNLFGDRTKIPKLQ
jgi:hypothetical protein